MLLIKKGFFFAFVLLVVLLLVASGTQTRPLIAGQDNALYLPFAAKPPIDLKIDSLEITQAIQNSSNTVPLVQDRPTTVRIYAKTSGATAIANVSVSLTAFRDGNSLGNLTVGPGSVSPTPSRANYESSFNTLLPVNWLAGNVTLTAVVDSANNIPEGNESNNSIFANVSFNPVPPLHVVFVPINYTHVPTGIYFPSYPVDVPEFSEYIMKIFPLHAASFTYRPPINFAGDLSVSSQWNALLNEVFAAKYGDGAPESYIYYGLLPTTNANNDTYPLAWSGWGSIGGRASVGVVEGSGLIASHEFGHNFGRRHSPCGNPPGVDPSYPYPDGSIGQYGLDVMQSKVWTPGPPDSSKDLMSYCGPRWVSDYTYLGLYYDQLSDGGLMPQTIGQGLLLQIFIDEQDVPTFRPVYELETAINPLPTDSQYSVALLDSSGLRVATYPVLAYEEGEDGSVSKAINVVLPLPLEMVASIQLWSDNQLLAEHRLEPSLPPLIVPLDQGLSQTTLNWNLPNVPVLIRYQTNNDMSSNLLWATIGVNVTGGEFLFETASIPTDVNQVEIIFGR